MTMPFGHLLRTSLWYIRLDLNGINAYYIRRNCCLRSDSEFTRRSLTMFEVTDKAGEVIKEFLEGKDNGSSVRITLMEGG